jgi:hypothetical protein
MNSNTARAIFSGRTSDNATVADRAIWRLYRSSFGVDTTPSAIHCTDEFLDVQRVASL